MYHGCRWCFVYGAIFGMRDDWGRVLSFAGVSEHFGKREPGGRVLLVGGRQWTAGCDPCDADCGNRTAFGERRDSRCRHANEVQCSNGNARSGMIPAMQIRWKLGESDS